VDLHSFRQEIGSNFIVCSIRYRKHGSSGAGDGFLTVDELPNHFLCRRHTTFFSDGGAFCKIGICCRCGKSERTNSFCDRIDCIREFRIFLLKHQMQCLKHWSGDVPVKIMCFEIERVCVREQVGQTFRDLPPILFANSDINLHSFSPSRLFSACT